ncbi:proton-conducting transporter membrane subunit [Cyanobium sp. CH-040]|uniref:proton-conducting transporter transmembrane domain-containing protein n=1 Tax=Cyanobium sp. CH-040 TaxID=2823708 RepID=UPI0020CD62EE|nr:proton-conducting transporter membrane subunit [Cyanobium sp. CH-040]MCP9926639.1 proton-conducting membrane transporter [Cyanobium sp. CH-040]
MNPITIAWLLLPLLAAFLAALLPLLARPAVLLTCLGTAAMALAAQQSWLPDSLQLLGPLGITLQPDALAAPFLLLNALVCAAVLLDGWGRPRSKAWPLLLLVLHGSVNSAIVAADLISIYVALEVVGIATFLLLVLGGRRRQVWLGLRLMLVSNTVMLLFLIGCGLLYLEQRSFALFGVGQASGLVLALLAVALLTKAEVFVAGLWLPRTNAEGPLDVSALLSGTVVSAGVVPLLRISAEAASLLPVLRWLGIASAAAGVLLALLEPDLRRLLAWSTLAQMGLVVILPAVGGLSALGHGLAKAALFLLLRRIPDPALAGWRQRPLAPRLWWPLMLASLSIAGLPPLLGFLAKDQLSSQLPGAAGWLVTAISAGTVAVYARIWGPPLSALRAPPASPQSAAAAGASATDGAGAPAGATLLVAALVLLSASPWALPLWAAMDRQALTGAMLKTASVFAAGLMLHHLLSASADAAAAAGPVSGPTSDPAAGTGAALPAAGWRPQLEGLDELLGAIVLLAAALLGLLGWQP